jgi:hypothetical protein
MLRNPAVGQRVRVAWSVVRKKADAHFKGLEGTVESVGVDSADDVGVLFDGNTMLHHFSYWELVQVKPSELERVE